MSVLPITEAFQAYLSDERHFSPYTARCYGADLRQYIDWLSEEVGIELNHDAEKAAFDRRRTAADAGTVKVVDTSKHTSVTQVICAVTADQIRGFLAFLNEQSYSAATMARKIATLRSFYKWADRRNYADTNLLLESKTQAKSIWPCSIFIGVPNPRLCPFRELVHDQLATIHSPRADRP